MKDKKITVLFDANPLIANAKSGVGYYTKGVIEALANTYPTEIKLVGHYFNFLGRKRFSDLPSAKNISYTSSKLIHPKFLSLLRRFGLQIPFDLLIKRRGEVAFFPNFVTLPVLQKLKKVVVIHDLCYKEFPQYVQPANRHFLEKFVPPSVKHTDAVVTISGSTRNAINKCYNVPANHIVVTPIPPVLEKSADHSQPFGDKKYILFMGTLEPRKNFISLARAYVHLPEYLKQDYTLVLAGGTGWNSDSELAEIKKYQEENEQIVLTGYVSDAMRQSLYAHASLFVLPSFYEGFGMPLLEAMAFDVPVIASNIEVFHEVCGNAAAYVDPKDTKNMTNTITELLTKKELRNSLIRRGNRQVKSYSWDSVARKLYDLFKSSGGGDHPNS